MSKLITLCPRLNNLGIKTEPLYPHPPVTNIFKINLKFFLLYDIEIILNDLSTYIEFFIDFP